MFKMDTGLVSESTEVNQVDFHNINDKENNLQKPNEVTESEQTAQSCHTGKAMRKEGQRNLHVSTFTISSENSGGDQTDESKKTSIRVKEPPGGKSAGFW